MPITDYHDDPRFKKYMDQMFSSEDPFDACFTEKDKDECVRLCMMAEDTAALEMKYPESPQSTPKKKTQIPEVDEVESKKLAKSLDEARTVAADMRENLQDNLDNLNQRKERLPEDEEPLNKKTKEAINAMDACLYACAAASSTVLAPGSVPPTMEEVKRAKESIIEMGKKLLPLLSDVLEIGCKALAEAAIRLVGFVLKNILLPLFKFFTREEEKISEKAEERQNSSKEAGKAVRFTDQAVEVSAKGAESVLKGFSAAINRIGKMLEGVADRLRESREELQERLGYSRDPG